MQGFGFLQIAFGKICSLQVKSAKLRSVEIRFVKIWLESLDIGSFVWHELTAWAQRAMDDVHVLARAYGWSESEVLALSAWRRQRYVELAGA